jgi:hypothetical protein
VRTGVSPVVAASVPHHEATSSAAGHRAAAGHPRPGHLLATAVRVAAPAAVLVHESGRDPVALLSVVAAAAACARVASLRHGASDAAGRWAPVVVLVVASSMLAGRVPAVAVVLAMLVERRALAVQRDERRSASTAAPVTALAVLVAASTGSGAATVGVLVVALVALQFGQTVAAALCRAGEGGADTLRWLVRAAGALLFGVLALPVLVLPWCAQRCWGVDPLASRIGSWGWQARERTECRPGRAWSRDRTSGRAPLGLAIRRGASAVLVAVILGALGAVLVRSGSREPEPSPPAAPAAAAAPWWDEYREVLTWLNTPGQDRPYDPFAPQRVRDVRSEHLNVTGGERHTWSPPPCGDCRRLTVWIYGGSTTFGIGQRDDHTIASQLARRALRDGLVLDVVNRGVPADLHWQEAQRFAWDVAGTDRPDLVVFFDGINELWAGAVINGQGRGDDEGRVNPEVDNASRIYSDLVPSMPTFFDPPRPDGAQLVEPDVGVGAELGPDQLAPHVLARYGRSLQMSGSTAAAAGVATRWFFQPCPQSAPAPEGEPGVGGRDAAQLRELCDRVAAGLPGDVVDLSTLYDGRDRPLFVDLFHTNEHGAGVAAEALYRSVRADLLEAEASPR